jgi:hypothetical protein
MSMDQKLTRLEKQLKYRLDPLQVQLIWFGDGALPENPPVRNGVRVSYVRYAEVACEHKQSTG